MDTNDMAIVDLRDPTVLERVLEEYLRFGACPVDGSPFPGLMKMVTVVLRLPDGADLPVEAQVVLPMHADRYVVQFQEPVDVARLRALVQLARRAARAGRTVSGAQDRPFEGAPTPRRRDRHLPRPDRSGVAPLKAPVLPQNPPPRVVRTPKR
ncbi:MAG TPA: hypothetical protein PLQ97_13730 [Myxococcota bacterium]|nr:hypothetical protein [Myxococcota bacterium]HQK52334.1 hypothetical protein [Myxococcota bacterium]